MNTTLASNHFSGLKNALHRNAPHVRHFLKLAFIQGPKRLLTSRISGKCAAVMVALCSPALLFFTLITIPTIIFQSPDQNAYFHFARVVEHDPSRWALLALAGFCTLMAMAVPATMPEPKESDFFF
jgi:hypothetical protein